MIPIIPMDNTNELVEKLTSSERFLGAPALNLTNILKPVL